MIALVQKEAFPSHGVMALAASLKDAGHRVELFIANETRTLIRDLMKADPSLIGITAVIGEHQWALNLFNALYGSTDVLLGGAFATVYPDYCLTRGATICVGEGDQAIAEYAEHPNREIPNIWAPERKTPIRPLVDVNSLPDPDRSIYYDKYPFLRKSTTKQFLAGRGCPFNCAYCVSHIYAKIYRNWHKVRLRDCHSLIGEINDVKHRYPPLKTVSFTDDVFIVNEKWLESFSKLYARHVALPFVCNIRADILTRRKVELLKKAGCVAVGMGVESGCERIRFNVLRRGMSNEAILKAGALLKRHGIALKTYNMIMIPTETFDEALQTVELNAMLQPVHASVSFLQPFPGYDIAKYAAEKRLLPADFSVDDVPDTIYAPSPVENADRNRLINLQTFFAMMVRHAKLRPLFKLLTQLPPNPLFRALAKLHYGYYMAKVHGMTLTDIVNYARHFNPFKI